MQSVAICWHEREFFVCNYVYEASSGQWTFTWQSSTRILTTTWYFGAASAVMQALYRTVEDHCWPIYRFVHIRTLNCGPELWVVIEKTSLRFSSGECQGLALEIGWDLSSSSPSQPWRELAVQPLLLRVKRNLLKLLRHLIKIPPGGLPLEMFRRCPSRRRPRGRHQALIGGISYPSRAWELLGVPKKELESVAGEKEDCSTLLNLLPLWSMETALQIFITAPVHTDETGLPTSAVTSHKLVRGLGAHGFYLWI